VLGSPESLAQGTFPKRLARNPRELTHPLPHQEERLLSREVRAPKGRPEGARKEAEQSYNPILPLKVGNRRASARSGHGTHGKEGGSKRTNLLKGDITRP